MTAFRGWVALGILVLGGCGGQMGSVSSTAAAPPEPPPPALLDESPPAAALAEPPPPDTHPPAQASGQYYATRVVTGPNDDLGDHYNAYAYVLLTNPGPTHSSRVEALCNAYLEQSDDHAVADAGVEERLRVVTVWQVAADLSDAQKQHPQCSVLIQAYDYGTAAVMIHDLNLAGKEGPFLIAREKPFVLHASHMTTGTLVLDLSGRSADDVAEGVHAWTKRMAMGHDQMQENWALERIRLSVRSGLTWVTDQVLFLFKPSNG